MNGKTLVKQWYSAIDGKNFEKLSGLMSGEHRFFNPMSQNGLGPEEHLGMMQTMTSALKGEHSIRICIEEQNTVAVHGSWAGTHVGEFNGVPATGKKVQFTWSDFFKIENGKINEEYLEMNPMAIMAQIGDMETKEA